MALGLRPRAISFVRCIHSVEISCHAYGADAVSVFVSVPHARFKKLCVAHDDAVPHLRRGRWVTDNKAKRHEHNEHEGHCMTNIKTLTAATVLGATLASPAVTQAAAPRAHVQVVSSQLDDIGQGEQPRSTKRSYDIYQSGQYVGSNPDPNIRLQLQREYDDAW
jgi:hypothetical protein